MEIIAMIDGDREAVSRHPRIVVATRRIAVEVIALVSAWAPRRRRRGTLALKGVTWVL